MIKEQSEEIAEFITAKSKILNKPIKDMDDIRSAMGGLNSIKENYIWLDEQITPIEVGPFLFASLCPLENVLEIYISVENFICSKLLH